MLTKIIIALIAIEVVMGIFPELKELIRSLCIKLWNRSITRSTVQQLRRVK